MRFAIAAALSLCFAGTAFGQTPYLVTVSAATYAPLSGGTPVTFSSLDDGDATVPLGFTFPFFGVGQPAVNVGTNGLLVFGAAATAMANTNLPDAAIPNNVVAFWWDDMVFNAGGAATYLVSGAVGSRVFTLQFANWDRFTASSAPTQRNVQVKLYEGSGIIQFIYGSQAASISSDSASVGIENSTGTVGYLGLSCTAAASFCTGADWPANKMIQLNPSPDPDLVVGSVLVSNMVPATLAGGQPGLTFNVDTVVRNQGTNPASGFGFDIYLSADAIIDPTTDTLIGSHPGPLTVAGNTSLPPVTDTVTMARPANASYYIGVYVDPPTPTLPIGAVKELSETNNTGVVAAPILVGSTDLAGEISGPLASDPGPALVAPVVRNNGSEPAGPFDIQLFLSADKVLDVGDTLVATKSLTGLAGATTDNTSWPVTLPANLPGTVYYYILSIDPPTAALPNGKVIEVNETNNIAVSAQTVTLSQANLTMGAVEAKSPFAPFPPTSQAFFGEPLRVSFTLSNTGTFAANGFNTVIYLSDNAIVTSQDISLKVLTGQIYAVNETRTTDVDLVIPTTSALGTPLPDGDYYVGVVANVGNTVGESNLMDNIGKVGPVHIRQPAIDLSCPWIEGPTTSAVGELMPVFRVIRNLGNRGNDLTGNPFHYRYVLSGNAIISAQDIPLPIVLPDGTQAPLGQGRVAARADETASELVQLPQNIAPGLYHVGIVLDPNNELVELDKTNNAAASMALVSIQDSGLRVETNYLPDAIVGLSYTKYLAAVGGDGTYRWSLVSAAGPLPQGLSLSPNGVLSGTPTSPGISAFTVTVSSAGKTADARFVLRTISPTISLQVETTALPPAVRGQYYDVSLAAVGGTLPYSWLLKSGTLPDGLALAPDGRISGKPTQPSANPASLLFEVQDANAFSSSALLSLRVVEPGQLAIATVKLPDGVVGETYLAQQLTALGGKAPLSWTLFSGELPPGMVLLKDAGALAGTPALAGSYALGIQVADADGRIDVANLILVIRDRPIYVLGTGLPAARPGDAYEADIGSSAGASGSFTLLSGSLPPGLRLEARGTVIGAVDADAAARSYNFIVEVTDGKGGQGFGALSVSILPPAPAKPKASGCSCGSSDLASAWLLPLLLGGLAGRRRFRGQGRGNVRRRAVGGLAAMLAALVVVVVPAGARAQYLATQQAAAFVPLSGGTPIALSGDTAQVGVQLPFPFTFYGNTYTSLTCGTDGWIVFGSGTQDYVNAAIPTAGGPAMLAPWWDDLKLPAGSVSTLLSGTAPNRTFTIEYKGFYYWSDPPSSSASFQVVLHEADGTIDFNYGPTSLAKASASVGIQGPGGVEGVAGLACTNVTAFCGLADWPAGSRITFLRPADLVVAGLGAPPVVYTGVPTKVQVSLANLGAQGAVGTAARVYLSNAVPLNKATALVLGTSVSGDVPAGGAHNFQAVGTIPATFAQGTYYLFAEADPFGLVVEGNKTNNIGPAYGVAVSIGGPLPDLVAGAITHPVNAAPGASIAVTRTIHNGGNAPATGISYALYLSDNSVVTQADRLLTPAPGVVNVAGTLAAGADDTGTDQVTLPANLQPGRYYIGMVVDPASTLAEISKVNNSGVAWQGIVIQTGALSILFPGPAVDPSTPSPLPDGALSSPYGVRLGTAGGDGAYTWTLSSGALPKGLVLSPAGDISGTPSAVGTFPFTVQVSSAGASATRLVSLTVQAAQIPLTVVSSQLPAAGFGSPFVVRLSAVGGQPPYLWSLAAGSEAPPGLVLGTDGSLEGQPNLQGTFSFRVSVSDASPTPATASASLQLKVAPPDRLRLVTQYLPDGALSQDYRGRLDIAGGTGPFTWTLVETRRIPVDVLDQPESLEQPAPNGSGAKVPALPRGLSLEAPGATAVIQGRPQEVGLYAVRIRVNDSAGGFDTSTLLLHLSAPDGISIATQAIPDAIVGDDYETQLFAAGGGQALVWTLRCLPELDASGQPLPCRQGLPQGFVLTQDGRVRGSALTPDPDESGIRPEHTVYNFIVEVRDEARRRDLRGLSLTVVLPKTPSESGCSAGGAGPAGPMLWLASLLFLGLSWRSRRMATLVAALLVSTAAGCGSKPQQVDLCASASCEPPLLCDPVDGQCKCGGAGGLVCDAASVCDGTTNSCVWANCANKKCFNGTACDPLDGQCKCGGEGGALCTEGQLCDASSRICRTAPPCQGVVCSGGTACDPVDGQCKCGGQPCAAPKVCRAGACTSDPCQGVSCTGGTICDPADGTCRCGGGSEICAYGQVCGCPGGSSSCTDAQKACLGSGRCARVVCAGGNSCDPADGQCKCGGPGGPVCPAGQSCDAKAAACIGGDRCAGVTCIRGLSCDPEDGVCKCGGLSGKLCGGTETCISLSGAPACVITCDPRTQGCASPLGCFFSETAGAAYCAASGAKGEGVFCLSTSECLVGFHCQPSAYGALGCHRYCDTGAGQTACPAAQTCVALTGAPAGIGACSPN